MLRNNNVSEIKISKLCFCGNIEVTVVHLFNDKIEQNNCLYIYISSTYTISPQILIEGGIIEIYEHYTFT